MKSCFDCEYCYTINPNTKAEYHGCFKHRESDNFNEERAQICRYYNNINPKYPKVIQEYS